MARVDSLISTLLLIVSFGAFCVIKNEGSVFVFGLSLGAYCFIYYVKLQSKMSAVEERIESQLLSVLGKTDHANARIDNLEKEIASVNKIANLKKMGL